MNGNFQFLEKWEKHFFLKMSTPPLFFLAPTSYPQLLCLWSWSGILSQFYLHIQRSQKRIRTVFIWVSKSNWFCVYYATRLVKKLAPLFHPIRSKTKTNCDSLVHVFPHFALATCSYFMFWLVHLIICALCDWLEWLLWFWFYDTQLKTAVTEEVCEQSTLDWK